MSSKINCLGVGLLSVLLCGFAKGQGNPDFNLVLATELSLVRARVSDSALIEGRYVVVEELSEDRIEKGNARLNTLKTYAVDCKYPRKIALIGQSVNLQPNPSLEPNWKLSHADGFKPGMDFKEMTFLLLKDFKKGRANTLEETAQKLPVMWPQSHDLIAEYACQVVGAGVAAKNISSKLQKTGGIATLKELDCVVKIDHLPEKSFTLRFDEQLGFVQVSDIWRVRPFVNDQSIGFRSELGLTRINRKSGKLSAEGINAGQLGTGSCELAQNTPKKF